MENRFEKSFIDWLKSNKYKNTNQNTSSSTYHLIKDLKKHIISDYFFKEGSEITGLRFRIKSEYSPIVGDLVEVEYMRFKVSVIWSVYKKQKTSIPGGVLPDIKDDYLDVSLKRV